jgi:RNA polymerase sigma-70 factor (ECF subfamily)
MELSIMNMEPSTRADMLKAIPKLKAFAVSLCRNADRADDLVQETLLRAWTSSANFQPGTSMVPWLATILRNQFYTEYRKYRREVADADGIHAAMLESPADQFAHVECEELHDALEKLPEDMREAIVMVGAFGLSYEEAARSQNCPIGTIKSRVHRARTCLAAMLDAEEPIIPRFRRGNARAYETETSL